MQNVQRDRFDLTTRTICALLSQTLFGVPYTPELGVDWNAVFQESRQQSVCIQVFSSCNQIPDFPAELHAKIQTFLIRSISHNARIHAQHTELHKYLSALGVSYTVLKGAASAAYYTDPLSRAMGDVDFYVDKSDLDRAVALFQKEGFEASVSKKSLIDLAVDPAVGVEFEAEVYRWDNGAQLFNLCAPGKSPLGVG